MMRRWWTIPWARSSPEVRSASWSAARSGRVMSTRVVRWGSPRAASAAAKQSFSRVSPEWGPRHEAPVGVVAEEVAPGPGQAEQPEGMARGGGVEHHVIEALAPSLLPRSPANSSNAAISTVQAPDSSSRIFSTSASGTLPR